MTPLLERWTKMPLDGPARPLPKTSQLARKERRYRRKVASPLQWQRIAAERQGPCLVCGTKPPNELHHVLPRDRGGEDKAKNIAPLCRVCHDRIEVRQQEAVRKFLAALDDDTYAYVVTNGGEDVWERVYGLRYSR